MYGLFAELGPCLAFAGKNDTIFNEKSWSNFANILFLEYVPPQAQDICHILTC